jgi:hypothetical protein
MQSCWPGRKKEIIMGNVSNGNYKVFCAGDNGDRRWLIPNASEVKVSSGSAATWQVQSTAEGTTFSANGGYVAGNIKEGTVRLTSLENGGSGAYWDVDVSGDYYVIRCRETANGDKRYLDGKTDDGKVYLNDDTEKSGSQWLLIPA